MPRYIASDLLALKKKQDQEMTEYMKKDSEYIPVDLTGARTDFVKGEDNLEKSIEDVKRRYGLDIPIDKKEREGGEI